MSSLLRLESLRACGQLNPNCVITLLLKRWIFSMVNMSLSELKLVRDQGKACLLFRILSISVLSHPQRIVGSWVDNLPIQRGRMGSSCMDFFLNIADLLS